MSESLDNHCAGATPSPWTALRKYEPPIQRLEDDWSGLTDPARRRKLQNRLNQRAWRRRQAAARSRSSKTASLCTKAEAPAATAAAAAEEEEQPSDRNPSRLDSLCGLGPAEAKAMLDRFERFARRTYLAGSPRTDLLLTLIRFNVFRGLMGNNASLGFSGEWLECDAISPFCRSSDCPAPDARPSPGYLQPTVLQRTVEHHPWIDLFPFPNMRDNILLFGDAYDDAPLCYDLVDNRQSLGEWSGLIVWGDPWDPYSWEVSDDFVRKWAWVIQDCWELFASTNKWREKRGERPLFSPAQCSPLALAAGAGHSSLS